ncbi:Nuclear distribution protein nudE-like protein 1 [Psilocybe cubensis]|uniref:Nuclear distribution protein nudE-like protein 1 n=1 Tax=Psilocybe cubensis TaxID=181762 RepID=A0ACB8HGI3_PSICU|nr:Nuclear distribution protein nudE-like protein 1 [Psilocybe cubensis]KAH9486810.1 Nuclear distribution protein nudE-like protein 1 [Psilocybe cubensis]
MSSLFLPGQPLLPPTAPLPQLGPGVYERHGVVRASLLGPSRLDGSTLTVPRVQPHTPIPGSIVIGCVTRLSPLQALISITVVDGVPLPPGEEFTGVIRSQDVRATEKDRVKIGDSFRGGDVVRTQVISLGDARSYFVTTARNDLGVIFATSEAGKWGRSRFAFGRLIHDFDFLRSYARACFMAGDALSQDRAHRKEKMRKAIRYAVVELNSISICLSSSSKLATLSSTTAATFAARPVSQATGPLMTAVMSATDALRKDRHMSLDDNNIGFSSNTDWQEKYNEVLDMLAETRAELDEFHQASKELEAELESELARTEKSQQELQTKVSKAEHERDEWKGKFISLQTTHNTMTTSLQRELDQLRQEHQKTKVHLRELEMGNDDLERNERAVSSSLADMEAKYSKALEEKILLEHELLEKATVEEDMQRLKDELRDANVEISILRDQLKTYTSRRSSSSSLARTEESRRSVLSTDDLLKTTPPSTIDLNDAPPAFDPSANVLTTPKASLSRPAVPSPFMRASQQDKQEKPTPLRNSSNMIRSTTLPSFSSPSTSSPRTLIKPSTSRNPTTLSTTSSTGSVAKNKGVQMVSDMRARVRNLEQKIHTRVPRLRMASITGRSTFTPSVAPLTPVNGTSSSSSPTNASTAKTSLDSQRKSESRQSNDSGSDIYSKKDTGDSSGWVLIMEDSPSPQKEAKRLKEKRRISNPSAPTAFRPTASAIHRPTSPSLSTGPMNPMAASTGLRRPTSRLSGGGASSSASSASRPQTPTFLPMPSNSTYAPTSSMKRSTGPGASGAYNQLKRSSLGKAPPAPVPPLPRAVRERPVTLTGYPGAIPRAASPEVSKALPSLPDELISNVTIRPSSRVPAPTSSTSLLSKSRIGRPSGGFSGRKSGGGETSSSTAALDIKDLERPRS